MNTTEIRNKVDELIKNERVKDVLLQKVCEILKNEVYHYDWVGFYILNQSTNLLELGPYVGKPTDHTHIPVGKGVCGQVAESGKTMIVQDVSQMDNYIACSLDVQSEIVVPILRNGQFIAEIDIDSHSPAPFSKKDQELLEAIGDQLKDKL